MKTLTPALAAHLQGEVTTLATCWKLTRRDGVVMGFTDHDTDVVVAGQNFIAATGMTASAVSHSNTLRVDELDMEGLLSSDAITQEDILKGLYDYAEVEVFMVDYTQADAGKLIVRTGWMGEVTLKAGQFIASIRGLSQALQQPVGDIYSPGCRARLGDARCGVNLANYTASGVVSDVQSLMGITASTLVQNDGVFTSGTLTFTSGANQGMMVEIKDYAKQQFYFRLPLREPPAVGDSFVAVAGCDHSIATCKARFNNVINFRGEPSVPGNDRLFETSVTRSNW
jgi:uncharacterized phage protein (TIGR02218 family)